MKEMIFRTSDDGIVMNNASEIELVRCKNCAFALFKEGVVLPGHIVCTKPFTENWQSVKPNNWFCADGTRKEI